MNPLTALPEKVRQSLYIAYAIAGPVLIWTASKGWTGDSEYQLWIGLGTALGLVAVANTGTRARVRLKASAVPHVPDESGRVTVSGALWGLFVAALVAILALVWAH